jgi:hypothetical protein
MAKEVFWFSFVHVQKLKNEKEKVKEESRPPASRAFFIVIMVMQASPL